MSPPWLLGKNWLSGAADHPLDPTTWHTHCNIPSSSGLLRLGKEAEQRQSNPLSIKSYSFACETKFHSICSLYHHFSLLPLRLSNTQENKLWQFILHLAFIYRQRNTLILITELLKRHWSCTFTLNCTFQTLIGLNTGLHVYWLLYAQHW